MKYFITFNPKDGVIWGAGSSENKSFEDAIKEFIRYAKDWGISKKQKRTHQTFKTVKCAKKLYSSIRRHGYCEGDAWWIVNGEATLEEDVIKDYFGTIGSKVKIEKN